MATYSAVSVYTSTGADSLTISSQLAGATTYIDMGNGGNTATVDVTPASNYRGLTVNLGTGVNSLSVIDLTGTGQDFNFPGTARYGHLRGVLRRQYGELHQLYRLHLPDVILT